MCDASGMALSSRIPCPPNVIENTDSGLPFKPIEGYEIDESVMRRREFITLLGGAAVAWPLDARAQQVESARRIGVLMSSAESDPEAPPRIAAFQQGLEKLGWTAGRNIRIDYRWGAADPARMRAHAAELVRLPSEVILAVSSAVVAALRQETSSIPIVFVQVAEPVAQGFVASMARPGGNVTGFTNIEPSLGGKWLEVLKEIAPQVAQVALLLNLETAPYTPLFLRSIEAAAPSFAIKPIASPAQNAAEIAQSIEAFAGAPGRGLVVMPGPFPARHRDLIIATAAKHRLPAVYEYRYFVTGGGLISYGADAVDLYRRAAAYIDRILRGEKSGDLPVQAPTKFELAVNLKTAKALGLTVPPTLIVRADEVIE